MIGVYVRALKEKIHGTPEQAARRAHDHGLTMVPILACWQSPKGTALSNGKTAERIIRYAEAFEAAGVDPWLWGYPWATRIDEYVDRIQGLMHRARGLFFGHISDPELGLKPRDGRTREQCEAAALQLSEISDMVTSYGMAAGPPDLPWTQLAAVHPPRLPAIGSPQFYKTPPADIPRGLDAWERCGFDGLVPSVPAYGPYSKGELDGYLAGLAPRSRGFLVWSWRQMDALEWRTVAQWSERFRG